MAYTYDYLSEEQADDILQHLIRQLEANGLSDIVSSIQESLAVIGELPIERTDRTRYEEYPRTSRTLLLYYLTGAIDYLQNISSHHYQSIVDNIAKNLSPDGEKLENIKVRYSPLGSETAEQREVSLAALPDYSAVITSLENIRQQLDGYETPPQQG